MPEGRAVRPHNSKQMQRICLESLSFYDRLKSRRVCPCGSLRSYRSSWVRLAKSSSTSRFQEAPLAVPAGAI